MGKDLFGGGKRSDKVRNYEEFMLLSDKKKRANNFKIAKGVLDYYADLVKYDPARIDKFNENYELHRGSWSNIENMSPTVNLSLQNENISLGGGTLRHIPRINIVSHAIHGEVIATPLITMVRDNSSRARNLRQETRVNSLRDSVMGKYFEPKRQEILKQVLSQYGINNISSLSQEEIAELEKGVTRKVQEETSDDLLNSLEKTRTPDEQIAQIFMNHLKDKLKLKEKFDLGGENAIVTGECYYKLGIRHNEPTIEVLNPKWVFWEGSENVERSEDAEYAGVTQYLTLPDVLSKHSIDFEKHTLKELMALYSPIPGKTKSYELDEHDMAVTDLLADNPSIQDPKSPNYMNFKTRKGQEGLQSLYRIAGHYRKVGHGIKETYVTWKWNRKAMIVERVNNSTGEVELSIEDEHYKLNKSKGDKRKVDIALPQVWHGTTLGEGANKVYLKVEPVPFQYNSIENVFDVKLPIFGGTVNTVMNNARNSSLIDLGKPLQFRYNVLMKKMEEYEATDIGKVIFGTVNIKPDGWSWGEWYQSIFVGKFGPLNTNYEGLNAQDRKPFYVEDLSRVSDIKATLDKLLLVERQMIQSMHYSPEKIGQISPYATNQNTQAAVLGTDKQLYKFRNKLRQFKESVLNYLLKLTLIAYKNNDYKKSILLDDYMRTYLEEQMEPFSANEFELYVVDDFKESERLEQMRQLALTIIQNGGSSKDIASILRAESLGQVEDILETSDRKIAKNKELEYQRQSELLEKQKQMAQASEQMRNEFLALEGEREREAKIRMAELNSYMMARANDINENQAPDSLESTLLKIESDERKLSEQLEVDTMLKREEFLNKLELERLKQSGKS
jgi:hypothetical protein